MGDVVYTRPIENLDHRCVGNQCYANILFLLAQTIRLLDTELFTCNVLPFLEELGEEHQMLESVRKQNEI
jgi:hypothetical protein